MLDAKLSVVPVCGPRHWVGGRRLAAVIVAAVAWCALLTGPTSAHFTHSIFTYTSCDADKPTDPLNFILYGPQGGNYLNNRYAEFARWTGWLQYEGGKQYFRSHGGCHAMKTQRSYQKNGDEGAFKRHTRFFAMPGGYPGGGQADFGDAHYERKMQCGNKLNDVVYGTYNGKGSGFDAAALNVAQLYYNNHRYNGAEYRASHQRQTFRQCNGKWVGWNGMTYWIYTPLTQ
jgi:hypothetical protein